MGLNCPFRKAMTGVTPNDPDHSSDEVSNPALIFKNNNDGMKIQTECLKDVLNSVDHRQRRFMCGNDMMYLASTTMTNGMKEMIKVWYANPMGENNKIVQSPTVEPESLFDCTGVYVLTENPQVFS